MKFYRYNTKPENRLDDLPNLYIADLQCLIFSLVKETPKGYWICQSDKSSFKKWVSKTSRKRYAYPTKEEALKSFIIRANRRIGYLKKDLAHVQMTLDIATKELESLKTEIK